MTILRILKASRQIPRWLALAFVIIFSYRLFGSYDYPYYDSGYWLYLIVSPFLVLELTVYHTQNCEKQPLSAKMLGWKKAIFFLLLIAAATMTIIMSIQAVQLKLDLSRAISFGSDEYLVYDGNEYDKIYLLEYLIDGEDISQVSDVDPDQLEAISSFISTLEDIQGHSSYLSITTFIWFIVSFLGRRRREVRPLHFLFASAVMCGLFTYQLSYYMYHHGYYRGMAKLSSEPLQALALLGTGIAVAVLYAFAAKWLPERLRKLLRLLYVAFGILTITYIVWDYFPWDSYSGYYDIRTMLKPVWMAALPLYSLCLVCAGKFAPDKAAYHDRFGIKHVTGIIMRTASVLAPYASVFLLYRLMAYQLAYGEMLLGEPYTPLYMPPLDIPAFRSFQGFVHYTPLLIWLAVLVSATGWITALVRAKSEFSWISLAWFCLYSGAIGGALTLRLFFQQINLDALESVEILNEAMRHSVAFLVAGAALALASSAVFLIQHHKSGLKAFPVRQITTPVLSCVLAASAIWGMYAFHTDDYAAVYGLDVPTSFSDDTPILAAVLASPPSLEPVDSEREWLESDESEDTIPFGFTKICQPSTEFARRVNDFAFRSTGRIFTDASASQNIVYSPVTSYMNLAMLTACTEGDAREELLLCMGLDEALTDGLDDNIGRLLREITCDGGDEDNQIMAGSVWLDNFLVMDESLSKRFANSFYATVFQADMRHRQTQTDINTWVRQSTRGMVPELTLAPDTDILLASTLYFDCGWLDTFDPRETERDEFHTAEGNTVSCEYMFRDEASYQFIYTENFTASYLPFRSGSKVHFILPRDGIDINQLMEDPQTIAKALDYGSSDRVYGGVRFKIPKVEFETEFGMDQVFQSMGLNGIYNHAKLTGISPDVRIADISIKQKNTFSMNEQGIRAASVSGTFIAVFGMSPDPPDYIDLILDRPFLFVITSGEGTVLFTGIVNDPSV